MKGPTECSDAMLEGFTREYIIGLIVGRSQDSLVLPVRSTQRGQDSAGIAGNLQQRLSRPANAGGSRLNNNHNAFQSLSRNLIREVRHNLCDGLDHVLNIPVAHAVKHRQTYQSLVGAFGGRIFAAAVTETIAIIRMKMDGDVINVYRHVFGTQRAKNLFATGG